MRGQLWNLQFSLSVSSLGVRPLWAWSVCVHSLCAWPTGARSGFGSGLTLGGRNMRPAAHLLFLSRQEKKAKEGAPTGRVPSAALRGNLRCSIRRWRCRTRCAPLALRSNNCSESEHEAWTSFGVHAHPARCASRHVHRGGRRIGPSLRSALDSQRVALARWGPSAVMARVAVLLPLWMRLGRGVGGVARAAQHARAS